MFIYYIMILLLSLLFTGTVAFLSKRVEWTGLSDRCETDADCRDESKGGKPGARCVYDKAYDKSKCLLDSQAICKIRGTNGEDWNQSLDEVYDGDKQLTICQEDSDCDGCINQPQWGCFKENGSNREEAVIIKSCLGPDCKGKYQCSDDDIKGEDGSCKVIRPSVDENGNAVNIVGEPITHGYCMPIVAYQTGLDGTSKCNSQTSDIFLTQSGEYSSQWSCLCRNPAMFSRRDTSTSNCVHENICGADNDLGELYMDTGRSCSSSDGCGDDETCCVENSDVMGNVCLSGDDTPATLADGDEPESYTCHKRWDLDNETDWSTLGKCKCKPGYTYITDGTGLDDTIKSCIPDQCTSQEDGLGHTKIYPKNGKVSCECSAESTKSISCPDDLPEVDKKNNQRMFMLKERCKAFPMCISDPCNPMNEERGGKYNGLGAYTDDAACSCPPGQKSTKTKANWAGSYCNDPCINNGPCGSGDDWRGYCRVAVDSDGFAHTECVNNTVISVNCGSKSKGECNGLCKWNDEYDTCVSSVQAGKGGCPCPWRNKCNEYTTEDKCTGKCEWDGEGQGPPSNNPYGMGARCTLGAEYISKDINDGKDSNLCSEQIPNITNNNNEICVLGENACCKADKSGYADCIHDKARMAEILEKETLKGDSNVSSWYEALSGSTFGACRRL